MTIKDTMQVDQFTTQITGEITFEENFVNGSDPVTHTRKAFMDCPPQNGVQLDPACNTCKLCDKECEYGCNGISNRDCLHPNTALNPYIQGKFNHFFSLYFVFCLSHNV